MSALSHEEIQEIIERVRVRLGEAGEHPGADLRGQEALSAAAEAELGDGIFPSIGDAVQAASRAYADYKRIGLEGRKAIVTIASGYDTFSKLTFDKTRKALQESGVPIYAIGIGEALREWYDAHGAMGPIARLDALQANNNLRVFAKETGGMAFIPRFYGEFPSIFRSISDALRHQYVLTYNPTNQVRDGKFRKIKVELINPATGEALRIVDEKNKPIKYQIISKNGYTSPREVE
jgi:VWFA-related protein